MTVWQRPGVLVWNAPAQPEALIARLRRYRYPVVAVKLHDGAQEYQGSNGTNGALVADLRRLGFAVGAWGYCYGADPAGEVELVAELVQRYRLAFYIADAEVQFEHTGANGVGFARSARWTDLYRAHLPRLDSALTSFGRASLHPLDWAAWQLTGFRFLPQAYWNENSALRPSLCVADAQSVGIELRRFHRSGAVTWSDRRFVHPMLGTYEGARGRVAAGEYRADLKRAGTRGFTLYAADFALDADYTA
jgi:hypothetical protein